MASFGNQSPIMGNANQVLGAPNALQQVGPSSPSFQPNVLPPSPMAVPQMAPQGAQAPSMPSVPGAQPVPNAMPVAPQAPMGQPNVMGTPPPPEALQIVKALMSRLSSLTKGEELNRGQQ